jgi:hypothetical protein
LNSKSDWIWRRATATATTQNNLLTKTQISKTGEMS